GRGPSVDSMRQRCARCGRTEWHASSEARPNTGSPTPPPTADGASGPRRSPATCSDPSSNGGGRRTCSCPTAPGSTSMSDPTPNTRPPNARSEEHTSELQSRFDLVCRLLLEKKKI